MKAPSPIQEIIDDCLVVRVRVMARAISAIYEQCLAKHEVTVPQVNLMATLGRVGPCSPSTVGEVLQLERSTVSRNVDLLIQKGLVQAVSSDAKGVREIALTAAGNKKIEAVLPEWRIAQKQASKLLGEEGVAAVHKAASAVWNPPV